MLGYSTRRIKFLEKKEEKTAANVFVNGKRWLPSHLFKLLKSQAPALVPTSFPPLSDTSFSLPIFLVVFFLVVFHFVSFHQVIHHFGYCCFVFLSIGVVRGC